MEPEETGGGHERQRDEEETRIAPAARGHSDRVAERNVQRSGGQDDPEESGYEGEDPEFQHGNLPFGFVQRTV